MTVADPYPETLAEIDESPINVNPDAVTNRLTAAINRLAQAVEQNSVALAFNAAATNTPAPVQNAPGAALTQLPPVRPSQPPQAAASGICPIHGTPWKIVPAGISKKTGNAYDAFAACSVKGCDQRPPR